MRSASIETVSLPHANADPVRQFDLHRREILGERRLTGGDIKPLEQIREQLPRKRRFLQ